MSTYVISDLHGCYTDFMEMLEKIKFDPKKDELIIAGDIIDRGPENLQMLRYMESKPESVMFLMGNHDYDFIGYCRGVEIMCDKGDGEWCKPSEAYHHKKYYDYFSDDYGTVKKLITG
ncbi:MAG: fructose-bisphosphatase class III [Clostridiales bacterium]|nr:fructose-bisphosphatase class III [Clostridiales bacterium]